MRRTGRWLLIWLVGLVLTMGTALGAPDRVVDQTGALSSTQRTALANGLAQHAIPYYVLFASAPTQDDLANLAHRYRNDQKLPADAVLIAIAKEQRLVYFMTQVDGPVDKAFVAQTGQGFSQSTNQMLQAFRGPAGRGDFVGAVMAVADTVDRLVPTLAGSGVTATPGGGTTSGATTAPSPGPSSVPSPGYTPVPSPGPSSVPSSGSRSPYTPLPSRAPSKPISPLVPIGVVALGGAGWWTVEALRYRRQRKQGLQERDAYAGTLLAIQGELPLLQRYEGAETHALVTQASAAIDAALAQHLEGETSRQTAEGAARVGRMIKARRTMRSAADSFAAAAASTKAAEEAWAPAAEALRQWDDRLAAAHQAHQAADQALGAAKQATEWPLGALVERVTATADSLANLEQLRQSDPIRAYRLLADLQASLTDLQGDIQRLQPLHQELQVAEQEASQLGGRRNSLAQAHDLRWVEGDPAQPIQQALSARARGLGVLPLGKVDEADSDLATTKALLAEAATLLDRYQTAIQTLPGLEAAVAERNSLVASLIQEASRLVEELTSRFDPADLQDVGDVATDLRAYLAKGQELAGAIPGWRSPSVQRLLTAHDEATAFLARWAPLEQQLNQLRARPAELEAILKEAEAQIDRLGDRTARAERTIVGEHLRLTGSLQDRLDALRERVSELEELGRRQRRPAGALRELARRAADQAADLLRDVEQLAQEAQYARAELARMQRTMTGMGRYSRYDRGGWMGQMDASMRAAEAAFQMGLYAEVLQHAHHVHHFHDELLAEFRRHEQQQQQHHHRSSTDFGSSGGGGSFGGGGGGGSDTGSTGGGGSW